MSTWFQDKLKSLGFATYEDYLQGSHWRTFRQKNIRQRCFCCYGKRKPFNLHHITYLYLGSERPEDVVTLCRNCHELVHIVLKEKGTKLETAHLKVKSRLRKSKEIEKQEAISAQMAHMEVVTATRHRGIKVKLKKFYYNKKHEYQNTDMVYVQWKDLLPYLKEDGEPIDPKFADQLALQKINEQRQQWWKNGMKKRQ